MLNTKTLFKATGDPEPMGGCQSSSLTEVPAAHASLITPLLLKDVYPLVLCHYVLPPDHSFLVSLTCITNNTRRMTYLKSTEHYKLQMTCKCKCKHQHSAEPCQGFVHSVVGERAVMRGCELGKTAEEEGVEAKKKKRAMVDLKSSQIDKVHDKYGNTENYFR